LASSPVGTLYRWFPDKAALAEALTDRYLERLMNLYGELLTDISPADRIGDFVRRVMTRLAAATRKLGDVPLQRPHVHGPAALRPLHAGAR